MEFFFCLDRLSTAIPQTGFFLRMATPYIIPPIIVLCDALKVLMIRSRNCVKNMFFCVRSSSRVVVSFHSQNVDYPESIL